MATIQVVGLSEVAGFLDRFKKGLADVTPFFNNLTVWMEDLIKQRVLKKGEGPDGSWPAPYNKYSESWAKIREIGGRKIDHVYLDWTGGMWSAMTHEVKPATLRVFFMPTPSNPIRLKTALRKKGIKSKVTTIKSNVTNAEKAYHLDVKRPFFGLNNADVDFAVTKFAEYVQQLINETR